MHERVLLDTGPLVAILSEHDDFHDICIETLRTIKPPLLTSWLVLAEAAWLLRKDFDLVLKLLASCSGKLCEIRTLESDSPAWMEDFLNRYRSLRPQLADASLMYLAERERRPTIFTLDRRDFGSFSLVNDKTPLLLPDDI